MLVPVGPGTLRACSSEALCVALVFHVRPSTLRASVIVKASALCSQHWQGFSNHKRLMDLMKAPLAQLRHTQVARNMGEEEEESVSGVVLCGVSGAVVRRSQWSGKVCGSRGGGDASAAAGVYYN